jgi:hypothetical protein
VSCSPPPPNHLGRPPREFKLRESELLYFKAAIRENGCDFVQLVTFSLVAPLLAFVHFAGGHRYRENQSPIRAQDAMNLSKRSSIVSYVLEYFKKQYGIQVPLGEWERLHGTNGKNNVSQILVPSPRALKGIAIDINLYEKSRPSAHVPDKNARTASNIRSDSEGITQKIMN